MLVVVVLQLLECFVFADRCSNLIMSKSCSSEFVRNSYRCDICNRAFSDFYGIQNHVEIHVTDQSHSGHISSKQFISSDSVQRHKKNKHSTSNHVKSYECHLCKMLFPFSKIKDHYLEQHLIIKPFQCTICGMEFSYFSSLQRHEKCAHQKGGKMPVHKCEFCDKVFATKYNLNAHLLIHSEEKPFVCDVCGKSYADRSNLRRHRLSHERRGRQAEPLAEEHVCKLCNKGFSVPYRLKEHIARMHTGEKRHICNVCGKSYSLANDLKRHSFVHTGERFAKCDICDKEFLRTFTLKRHMQSHASEREKHTCSICGITYTRLWNLQRHMTSHDGTEPFICNICGDKFIWKIQLTEHLADKHDIGSSNHQCLFCDKQFNTQRKLYIHNHKHMHKKNISDCPSVCEICGKVFKAKATLTKHRLTHTKCSENERPYSCSICNKGFAHLYTRNKHMSIHNKELAYKCNVCNKGFTQASVLNTHMKIHTGDNFHSCTVCNRYYTRAVDLENHLRKETHDKMINLQNHSDSVL